MAEEWLDDGVIERVEATEELENAVDDISYYLSDLELFEGWDLLTEGFKQKVAEEIDSWIQQLEKVKDKWLGKVG